MLKPGGRLAVSDIALKRDLPSELGDDLMAYVGCIAGAILIEDYRRRLIEAGFAHVEVIDSGSDLNAYAQVENQALCCPPPVAETASTVGGSECCPPTTVPAALPIAEMACCVPPGPVSGHPGGEQSCCSATPQTSSGLAVVDSGCCPVGPAAVVDGALHARLADLLRRYDVNDYAASVKVFAVKPR